jgi:Tol biopolymer transport system component
MHTSMRPRSSAVCLAVLWLCALLPTTTIAAVCGDPSACTHSRRLYPSWSPDGTRIVFVAFRGYENAIGTANGDGTGRMELIGPLGEAETANTSYLYRRYPTWSPDGMQVAYSTSGPVAVQDDIGPNDIYISPIDRAEQGAVRNLTNHPAEDFHPRWSPDGSRIAFASNRDGDFDIYTIRVDGTALRQLTDDPASDSHPGSWSPDGQQVAFVSDRDGNPEIYVVNADGTGATRLTSDPATDSHPAFSPDGTRIAFHSNRDGNDEIYVMNADGSGQTRLTNRAADDFDPSWSPDGQRIAFATDVDAPPEAFPIGDFSDIHTIRPDGTDEIRITTSDVAVAGKKLSLKGSSAGSITQLKLQSTRGVLATPRSAWGPALDASLRIVGAGFDQTYPLPRRDWRQINAPIIFFDAFEYRSTGPVRLVKLRPTAGIKVVVSGTLAGSLLADPSPVSIVLTAGRLRYCMTFAVAKTFKPGIKYVAIDAAAPDACLP